MATNGSRAEPLRWVIVVAAAAVGLLHLLGALQVREQVFRGYRRSDDGIVVAVTQGGPAARAASGLNVLVACIVLGLAPMIPTAAYLVAPDVMFPGSAYYDLTWVLIPFALARATVLQASREPARSAGGQAAPPGAALRRRLGVALDASPSVISSIV